MNEDLKKFEKEIKEITRLAFMCGFIVGLLIATLAVVATFALSI
jgi:hypothetical protein